MYNTKAISYHYMPFRNRYVGLLGIILVILISICRHTIIITYRAGLFHDSHHHYLNFSMPLFSETCSEMDHLDFEFDETCFSVNDKIDKKKFNIFALILVLQQHDLWNWFFFVMFDKHRQFMSDELKKVSKKSMSQCLPILLAKKLLTSKEPRSADTSIFVIHRVSIRKNYIH